MAGLTLEAPEKLLSKVFHEQLDAKSDLPIPRGVLQLCSILLDSLNRPTAGMDHGTQLLLQCELHLQRLRRGDRTGRPRRPSHMEASKGDQSGGFALDRQGTISIPTPMGCCAVAL